MANQSAFAMLIVLLVCAWAGRLLLYVLGISVPMLQAAGGLILLLYGIHMVTVDELKLTAAEQVSAEEVPEEHWKALAVVPLAIPGTVGAGSITTVVIQATAYSSPRDLAIITGVCVGTALDDVADVPIGRPDREPARADRAQHRDPRHGHPRQRHRLRSAGEGHRRAAARPGALDQARQPATNATNSARGTTPSPGECRCHQRPNRGPVGLLQGADFYVTQPLAGALQQPFRVRQHRPLIEAEIDVAAHRHDVGVAIGHVLRPDAIGGGVVAEPHGLSRADVDGPDYGPQAPREGGEVGLDTLE